MIRIIDVEDLEEMLKDNGFMLMMVLQARELGLSV